MSELFTEVASIDYPIIDADAHDPGVEAVIEGKVPLMTLHLARSDGGEGGGEKEQERVLLVHAADQGRVDRCRAGHRNHKRPGSRIKGVPETYFLDQEGVLRHVQVGPFTSVDDIKSVIDPMLK